MKTPRVALIAAESCASGPAVRELASRLGESLVLVLASHPEQEGSFAKTAWGHWRRSGSAFVWFLLVNFTLYRLVVAIADRMRSGRRCPPVGLDRYCRSIGVDFVVTRDVNDADTLAALRHAAPDVIVVYYFDKILHDEAIALGGVVVNVHTALLPNHRGLFPEVWALSYGESTIGVTAHLIVNRGIDSGPILDSRCLEIEPGWSVLEASTRAHCAGVGLVVELIGQLDRWPEIATGQQDGSYHSLPDRAAVRRLRSRRRALARMSDAVRASTCSRL